MLELLFKKLPLSKEQKEILNDESKSKEEKEEIIESIFETYDKHLLENPNTEKSFKEKLAPKLLSEASAKERKQIVDVLKMNISKTKATTLSEEDWQKQISEHIENLNKSVSSENENKIIGDLNSKIVELNNLLEEKENEKNEAIKLKESEFRLKQNQNSWNLLKEKYLSGLQDTVLPKETISDLIELEKTKRGISVDFNDKNEAIFQDKDGKIYYENNKPLNALEFLENITTNHKVKTPPKPPHTIYGKENEGIELTPAEMRLKEMAERQNARS